eukprot:Gregarina_sp_Poly_1__3523@NODE_2028_length_2830_cov_79_934853_g1311_i0_p1_GENE_NODE_2028_length_2830_cov_79_934853_g1311_i0NODE_2028_length_2830_cov_79_934853_g1311_i0_p1_ORF_typecomplete_len815_score99_17_NODE_2028_length_2830_cov_79_934853_g1311_i02362680
MRCVIVPIPSKPPTECEIFLSIFSGCFAALVENRPQDLSVSLTKIKKRDETIFESEKFKSALFESEGIEGLVSAGGYWYRQQAMDTRVCTDPEVASVVGKYYEMFRSGAWNEWNPDLFLGLMTMPHMENVFKPDSHIFRTLNEIKGKFPRFLNWLDCYTKRCISSIGEEYSTVVAFRYFIFKLLRLDVLFNFWRELGWEAPNPAENMWELFSSNQNRFCQHPLLLNTQDVASGTLVPWLGSPNGATRSRLEDLTQRMKAVNNTEQLFYQTCWDQYLDNMDQVSCRMMGWEIYLFNLFRNWQESQELTEQSTEQEVATVIGVMYDIGLESYAWNLEWTEDVSLFLSLTTSTQVREVWRALGLESHIAQTMNEIQRKFPKFLKWVDDRAKFFLSSPHSSPHYATLAAFRYFIFEIFRIDPAASRALSETFGWESHYPGKDIWSFWKENYQARNIPEKKRRIQIDFESLPFVRALEARTSLKFKDLWQERVQGNAEILVAAGPLPELSLENNSASSLKKPSPTPIAEASTSEAEIGGGSRSIIETQLLKACKAALANSTNDSNEGTLKQIPVNKFRLFFAILRKTTINGWKEGIMKLWEAALFEDDQFFKDPIAQGEGHYDHYIKQWQKLKGARSYERRSRHKLVSTIDGSWPTTIWPELLRVFRPAEWNSNDWVLILAVASVNWDRITDDIKWKNAAANCELWNFLSNVEKSLCHKFTSVFERAAVRYFVLRSLLERDDTDYGAVWTKHVLQHMWERTMGTDVAQLTGPKSDQPTAFVTRQQFRNLMKVACSLVQREDSSSTRIAKHFFFRCVFQE